MDAKITKSFKIKQAIESEFINSQNTVEYKIIVLGDKGVGKTSLCSKFSLNDFNLEIKPSTDSECYMKMAKIFDLKVKMYIIDVVENSFTYDSANVYTDVVGAVIVYDITKSKTFDSMEHKISDLRNNINPNLPILFLGNKNDLSFLRNVEAEEAEEKADKLNCVFAETSCVDSQSVKDAFKLLLAKIYYNNLSEENKSYFKHEYNQDGLEKKESREKIENGS